MQASRGRRTADSPLFGAESFACFGEETPTPSELNMRTTDGLERYPCTLLEQAPSSGKYEPGLERATVPPAPKKGQKTFLGKALALGGLCLFLTGCSPEPTTQMITETGVPANEREEKYSIQRVAVFNDNLAYNEKRGIYEIRDNKTKRTYFGVSGIGIVEVGWHSDGETTVEDER